MDFQNQFFFFSFCLVQRQRFRFISCILVLSSVKYPFRNADYPTNGSTAPRPHRVRMLNPHLADAHIRHHKRLQTIGAHSRQPIERKAHRSPVRIQPIPHATKHGRIVARADQLLLDAIGRIIRDHHEQLARQSGVAGPALRYQQVLRPAAAAEVKRLRRRRARSARPVGVHVAERALERHGQRGLVRTARNHICAGIY